MSGFKSETERGVRSSFANIAKIAGVAFGSVAAFDFGKQLVSHAADVQKQIEAVKAEFGSASEQINKFADGAAAQLGISAHAAETTAARFGILFKNLNIGHDEAAQMTVGFEKLAGSLSLIRNVDPSVVLKSIPLAVAGNLRSLKQMGIATDQTQLKIAALKLGLTKSVSDGLTPSIRAQAIYAIATAHLGDFLEQARKHSHDLASQQRILSAEWDNAKDQLGRGLIPPVAKLTQYLVTHLPAGIKKVQDGFRTARDDINGVIGPLGGVKKVAEVALAAFAVSKIVGFARALRTNLIDRGLSTVSAASAKAQADYAKSAAGMRASSISVGEAIKVGITGELTRNVPVAAKTAQTETQTAMAAITASVEELNAAIATSVGLLRGEGSAISGALSGGSGGGFAAVGAQAQTMAAEINGAVKEATVQLEALKLEASTLPGSFATAAAGINTSLAETGPAAAGMAGQVNGAVKDATGQLEALKVEAGTLAAPFQTSAVEINTALASTGAGAKTMAAEIGTQTAIVDAEVGAMSAFVIGSLRAIKAALVTTGFGALAVAAGIAVAYVITHWKKVKGWFMQFKTWLTGQHWFQEIVAGAQEAIAKVGPIFERVKAVAIEAAVLIARFWRDWGGTIIRIVKNAFAPIVGYIRGIMLAVRGVINIVGGLIHGDWGRIWTGLKQLVKAPLVAIITAVTGFASTVEAIFEQMWKDIEIVSLKSLRYVLSLIAKVPTSFHVPGLGKIGITNPAIAALAGLDKTIKGIEQARIDKRLRAIAEKNRKAFQEALSLTGAEHGQGADSAAAAAQAQEAVGTQKKLLDTYTKQLTTQSAAGDAAVKKIKGQLAVLGQNLKDALQQENKDLLDAIDQAKQNLAGIGNTLTDQIGQILDKPIAEAQAKIDRLQHLRDLSNLRASVLLPGGKELSSDPTKAIKQLEALAKHGNPANRRAIEDFIAQYRQAALAVKQDQVNLTKQGATRRVSDLTDAFNRGKISYAKFRHALLAELHRDGVSYKRAGALLGSAFANGFRDSVHGLLTQAKVLTAAGKGRPFSTVSIVRPLEAIHADQREVARIQRQIRDKHGALQAKIASNTAKANDLLAKIHAVQLGPSAKTITDAHPGKGAKRTKTHANTTN